LGIYLVVITLISIFLLYSIKWMRALFSDTELVAFFLMLSSVVVISYNIVALNLELIKFNYSFMPYMIALFDRIFILPILTIWLLYFYRRFKQKGILKYVITLGWAFLYIGITYINHWIGVNKFTGWNPFIGFLEIFIIYILFIHFICAFHFISKEVRT
jgi:hypothetical protein